MRRYSLAFLIALFSAVALGAQAPAAPQGGVEQQPGVTFRAEANFVEVAAIVTGRDGTFVRDLTVDDFEIREDGVLQKPSVFQLIDLPVGNPAGALAGGAPVESDVRETRRTFDGRIYVLLLDDLHTMVTRTPLVKDGARKFVEQYLGPNDLAAVVYTSGRQESGQELTGSRRLLLAAIDRFIGRKIPSANVEKLAAHLRDADNNPQLDDAGNAVVGRTAEGAQRARDIKDPLDPERGLNARRALQAIENISNWLGDVQGRRKALLFFSEGIDYDIYEPFNDSFASAITQETQEAVSAAQRANVNIYGVDPRGLGQFGSLVDINARSDYPQLDYGNFKGALREMLLSQESLMGLSDQTGGLAIVNRNDVVGGLGRIVLDNSRYYLLGYYSDSTRWKGKFLKIDVKTKRPGLTVRARRGYLPPNNKAAQKALAADAKAGTTPALRAALAKPVPIGDLPFRAFATPFKGAGTSAQTNASVIVGIEIDGAALTFQEKDGRFAESLEVSIVAADERARVQGGDRQTFNLNLMPETRERVVRQGVRMLSRVDLPPGRYQIRVGAQELGGAAVATLPIDVEVPEYNKLPLSLSGVLLTSTVAGVAVTANAEVQPDGALPTPAVVRRTFGRGETLTTYFEAYDNVSATAHALDVNMSVRSAGDGQTIFQLKDRRDVEAGKMVRLHGFQTPLPLGELQPGSYILRVEAAAGGQSAQREIPFEVR